MLKMNKQEQEIAITVREIFKSWNTIDQKECESPTEELIQEEHIQKEIVEENTQHNNHNRHRNKKRMRFKK